MGPTDPGVSRSGEHMAKERKGGSNAVKVVSGQGLKNPKTGGETACV